MELLQRLISAGIGVTAKVIAGITSILRFVKTMIRATALAGNCHSTSLLQVGKVDGHGQILSLLLVNGVIYGKACSSFHLRRGNIACTGARNACSRRIVREWKTQSAACTMME